MACKVYFYPGMTHVKALMVDDWACLGSANLNHLSLRVCQEQNVATSDPAFAARLKRELFEEDFARSYEADRAGLHRVGGLPGRPDPRGLLTARR